MVNLYVELGAPCRACKATTKAVHPNVMLDFNTKGELIGVEILDAEAVSVDGNELLPRNSKQ